MKLEFRRAAEADLAEVLAIERATFAQPWTPEAIRPELADHERKLPLLAVLDGVVVGFALVWVIVDEVHLVNFAVDPERRRQGIGRALLREVLDRARRAGARMVTLEVRAGNEAARELYRHAGFVEVALRPRYYPDTREDALIMLCDLSGGPLPG